MREVWVFVFLSFLTISANAQNSRQALDNRLETLKKQDKLSEWIYERIAYNAEKPEERLAFLISTSAEAWRKPVTPAEFEAWLNLLINQGYYQLYTGNVLQSIEEYEKAYSFYRQKPTDIDLVEYILKPLGNNYTRLGDYTNAIFIQKKSLEIATKQRDSLAIASVYNNLAISYKSMGDLKQASRMCLTGFSYLGKKSSLGGLLNSTLADIQFEQGDVEKASKNISLALSALSRHEKDSYIAYWLLSAYTLAGNIEQHKVNFRQARAFYQQGLQLIEERFRGSRRREKANLLIQTGNILLKEGQPSVGLIQYNRALETLLPGFRSHTKESLPASKILYGENRLYDALEGRANALLLLKKEELALENFLLALKTGSKTRNEFSETKDRLYYQQQSKHLAEKAINTAYGLWERRKEKKYLLLILSLAEQTKARTLSEHIERNRELLSNKNNPLLKKRAALRRAIAYYEKEYLLNKEPSFLTNKQETQHKLALLEREIRKKYPFTNESTNTGGASLQQLIKNIPEATQTLNFFWGKENVYMTAVSKGGIDTIVRIANAADLKQRISGFMTTYFKQGASAMTNHPENFYTESNGIYKRLKLSVLGSVKGKKTLIIADDILGYLPFESLITSSAYSSNISAWPFLIRVGEISYAYSLQTWLGSPTQKSEANRTFSGFFISNAPGQPPIPAVQKEAENLGQMIEGTQFIDQEATTSNFRHALNTASTIHLSTHSYFFGKEKEPVLQLFDQKFFLFELSAQTRVPRLVVLSSCGTADGVIAGGEGILSLSRGFTAAGTRGVVAGLWNINDASSSQIISIFYHKLQQGKDVSTALHQAKLDWIAQNQSNHALVLPYYWASLTYIGKPQTIQLESATDYRWMYWILFTFSIAAFTGFIIRRKIKGRMS